MQTQTGRQPESDRPRDKQADRRRHKQADSQRVIDREISKQIDAKPNLIPKKCFFYDLVQKKLQKNQNYQKIEKTLQN